MANDLLNTPLFFDTASAGYIAPCLITSVLVIPTADTWSCVLHDKSGGRLIFKQVSALANERNANPLNLAVPLPVKGVYATTLTNCQVLVYLKEPTQTLA